MTDVVNAEVGQLREIAINLVEKEQVADIAVVINNEGNIVASANDTIVEKGMKMGDVINLMAEYLGGKGGGKANLAQGAGMKQQENTQEAFQSIRDIVNKW